ncbi:MAG: nucleoside deaminase [Proteobacteria bacterium]|nr:nucleoside deaminase [Pseudomonadota bacterium]
MEKNITPDIKKQEHRIAECERFMREALKEARLAFDNKEVPIGAVIEYNGEIFARGRNRRIEKNSSISHAEIEAIQDACKKLGDWRLENMTIYITSEPCLMCAGAIVHSRIKKVVYGCKEPKMGAIESRHRVFDIENDIEYIGGILEKECSGILTRFFENIRKEK